MHQKDLIKPRISVLLKSIPQHILMQNLLKSMINSVNQKYVQNLYQYLQYTFCIRTIL